MGSSINERAARSKSAFDRAIADARRLVNIGIPVVVGRLDSEGNPTGREWQNWQNAKPDLEAIAGFRPGLAMAAVLGGKADGIDIDPRHGGDASINQLSADLGDDGPEVYWEVRTARGGKHLWIAPQGMGRRIGFRPGLDLLGSPSLAFLPPTQRHGGTYAALTRMTIGSMNGDGPCAALQTILSEPAPDHAGTGREEVSTLRQACMDAQPGLQRGALLRYVHELERKGYERDDILTVLTALVAEMPVYNKRRPWRIGDLRGLLHKPGEVSPDGTADESFAGLTPQVRRGGLRRLSSVEAKVSKHLWERHLTRGDATIIDGDPGTAKSLITVEVAARYTTGRPMPNEKQPLAPPGNVLFLAPEDRPEVILARVRAAGGNVDRVFIPEEIELSDEPVRRTAQNKERKATYKGEFISFPDAARTVRQWINEYDIGLVIVDPVTAFLSERTNSNNDASVRRALEPLAYVLGDTGCAAIFIRHLNKDKNKSPQNRGGGSVAFGAVARIQLLTGELPPELGLDGDYGLTILKANNQARTRGRALTYSVVDSAIAADDQGNKIPKLVWHGIEDIPAHVLASGLPPARGPQPNKRDAVGEILGGLFARQTEWRVTEVDAELQAELVKRGLGHTTEKTIRAARDELGYTSVQREDGWWMVPVKAQKTKMSDPSRTMRAARARRRIHRPSDTG